MRDAHFCPFVISPTGIGDPDCINAARNNPSLFPSFATICRAAETAPADSPQLRACKKKELKASKDIHGNFSRIPTELCDVFSDPSEGCAFYPELASESTT